MKNNEVIARTYVRHNGEQCNELVRAGRNLYRVLVNGAVQDTRVTLTPEQAAEFWDFAGYQIGKRPEI